MIITPIKGIQKGSIVDYAVGIEKALAVATKRKNKEMIAILNNRLGLVYELQQENDKAIERFTIARDLFLELNDQNNVNDNQTHIDKLSPSVSLR